MLRPIFARALSLPILINSTPLHAIIHATGRRSRSKRHRRHDPSRRAGEQKIEKLRVKLGLIPDDGFPASGWFAIVYTAETLAYCV